MIKPTNTLTEHHGYECDSGISYHWMQKQYSLFQYFEHMCRFLSLFLFMAF